MENIDELVGNFVAITGATTEQARFFLESTGGDLSSAMDNFYESNGDMDEMAQGEEAAPPPAPPVQQSSQVPQTSSARPASARARKPTGNIRSFSDLRNAGGESDDDDDGPREFYTGGEKSGMMVQDPKNQKSAADDIEAIFEKARQHGATTGTPEDLHPSKSRGSAFAGVGRTLADSPNEEAQAPAQGENEPPQPVLHTVTFYNNGFTVDDGPLRKQDDPANKPFMQSIEKGECPVELEPRDRKTPVHVNLVRRAEDYTPPPAPRYVAFSGGGRTLGSQSSSEAPAPPPPAASTSASAKDFHVDESQPVTSLQLRLHDGTRMVARFNHTHTVQDIRNFISHARPTAPANFRLMTSFPTKELANPDESIAEAGLIGAVVMQQL